MKKHWKIYVLFYLIAVVVVIMLAFSRALPLPVVSVSALALFAIPFVREFMHRHQVDERQVQISRFSSSMAFYAYLALLITIVIKDYLRLDKPPGDAMLALLVLPLAVKMYVSLLQNFDAIQAGRCLASFFAGIWLIFVVLSHGLSLMSFVEALPFLFLVGLTFAVKQWPRICGVLLVVLGCASTYIFVIKQKTLYTGLLMFAVLALPMILSGMALLAPKVKTDQV